LGVGCPVLSFQVFEEADSYLMAFAVAVGACASADFLVLFTGGFHCCAEMLAELHFFWAIYDSGIIVSVRVYHVVSFAAIREDDREIPQTFQWCNVRNAFGVKIKPNCWQAPRNL
jgi:hypothetical protein